ncbi:MAG: hypothetical protein LC659_06315 [Myxococcales bacterium]|nr:hypothetical protein [Myxococcales bacterium]
MPRRLELARRSEELEALLAPNEPPLRASEVPRETGVESSAIAELEASGLVAARRALLPREVELFGGVDASRDDIVRLARAVAVGASELVAALHRELAPSSSPSAGSAGARRITAVSSS